MVFTQFVVATLLPFETYGSNHKTLLLFHCCTNAGEDAKLRAMFELNEDRVLKVLADGV